MKLRITIVLLAVLVGAFVAAGCGSDDDESSGGENASTESSSGYGGGSSGGGSAQTLKIDADPTGQLKFTKDKLSAKAGTVTIEMGNPSDIPHAVEIEGNGVEEAGETVQKGGKSAATAEVQPGTYEFYCPVGSHQQAGMTGTLTVK